MSAAAPPTADEIKSAQMATASAIVEHAAQRKRQLTSSSNFFIEHERAKDTYDYVYFCALSNSALRVMLLALSRLSPNVARQYAHLYMRHAQGVDLQTYSPWCSNEILNALVHPPCAPSLRAQRVHIMDSVVVQLLKMHRAEEGAAAFAKRLCIYDEKADLALNSGTYAATHFSPHSAYNCIVVPLHSETRSHWSLVVFFRSSATLKWRAYHYDSLSPCCKTVACSFVWRLATELLTVDNRVEFDMEAYETCTTEVRVPKQDDGWTCGYRVAFLVRMLYEARCDLYDFHELIASHGEQRLSRDSIARSLAEATQTVSSWRYLIGVSSACDNIINYEVSALLNMASTEEERKKIKKRLYDNDRDY